MNGSLPISPPLRSNSHDALHPTVFDNNQYTPMSFESTGGITTNSAAHGIAALYGHPEHFESGHELQTIDPRSRY